MIKTHRIQHSLLLVTMIGLMNGCSQSPDCSEAIDEGRLLGAQGQMVAFDETRFDKACRGDFLAAWETAKNEYCDPTLAFDRAMAADALAPACQAPAYLRNFQLGANLAALLAEKASIESALDLSNSDTANPADLQMMRMRLRVLEREIPELETLARMRGLMEPAELPPEIQ